VSNGLFKCFSTVLDRMIVGDAESIKPGGAECEGVLRVATHLVPLQSRSTQTALGQHAFQVSNGNVGASG
jgi:hypothetical protein